MSYFPVPYLVGANDEETVKVQFKFFFLYLKLTFVNDEMIVETRNYRTLNFQFADDLNLF